jgi:hypothetical protein
MSRHPRAKFGMILFSVQPLLVRWPTNQTEFDFRDVLDEGMRFTNPARTRTSQLARFAGGTATRAGLAMAHNVLEKQNASNRSLILIGDLIDNIDEVTEGVKTLGLDDIYVHVIALDAQAVDLDQFSAAFEDKPNIHVYPVQTQDELAAAFLQVDTREEQRRLQAGTRNYAQDIRWFIALIGFAVALAATWLFQTKLHSTRV